MVQPQQTCSSALRGSLRSEGDTPSPPSVVPSVLCYALQADMQPPAGGGQGRRGLIQVRSLISLQGRFPGDLEGGKEVATQRARGGALETGRLARLAPSLLKRQNGRFSSPSFKKQP